MVTHLSPQIIYKKNVAYIASFLNDDSLKFNIWKLYILFKKRSGPF